MLLSLHKRSWTEGLKLRDFKELEEGNEKAVKVCFAVHDPVSVAATQIAEQGTAEAVRSVERGDPVEILVSVT